MKIQGIYDKYKIMPQLQLHMLRVAGVASIICDNFEKDLDKNTVISVCLLHDIGNIVRFKLKPYPEDLKPKGYKYWKSVQNNIKQKYGSDDYEATYKILKEIGIPTSMFQLIHSIEFSKLPLISLKGRVLEKICVYADSRVAPKAVVSLNYRLSEVRNRYIKNREVTETKFSKLSESAQKIEKQVFAHCNIKPEDITDEKVNPLLDDLRDYEIETR